MFYSNFLNDKDLDNIKNHKYKPGVYTELDKILNPFWVKLASFIPKSIAPNTVTLIGFIVNILPFILCIINDYTLKSDLSYCMTFFSGLCIFLYQTLDALDGKHAKNTKRSSPLGQLFDHGCDSIGTIFLVGIVTSAIGSTDRYNNNILILQSLNGFLMFYFSNWAEMYTHVLQTSSNGLGVTEVQYLFIFIIFIAKIFKKFILEYTIFSLNTIEILNIILFFIVMKSIIEISKHELLKLSHFKTLFSFSLLYISGIITIFFKENILSLLILSHGIIFSILALKAILSSLSKKSYKIIHYEVIIHFIIILIAYYVNQKKIILIIWIIFELILLGDFVYVNIIKISKALKIEIF